MPTKTQEQKIELASRHMARLYSTDTGPRVCACIGIECLDVECAAWWRFVLSKYSADDMQRMIAAHQVATGERHV